MYLTTPIFALLYAATLSLALPQHDHDHNHGEPTPTSIPTSILVDPLPTPKPTAQDCVGGSLDTCMGSHACILSWPGGCICQNGVKTKCAVACKVPVPELQDCGVDPVDPPEPIPTKTVSTKTRPHPTDEIDPIFTMGPVWPPKPTKKPVKWWTFKPKPPPFHTAAPLRV